MNTLELDRKMIHDYQQNRDPYLMIDHATEVRPGLSARGFKDFKNNEWFSKCIGKMIQMYLECYKSNL